MTLSHPDKAVRKFWIEHGICSREIGRGIWQGRSARTALTTCGSPTG